jgi:hypothetical protein
MVVVMVLIIIIIMTTTTNERNLQEFSNIQTVCQLRQYFYIISVYILFPAIAWEKGTLPVLPSITLYITETN